MKKRGWRGLFRLKLMFHMMSIQILVSNYVVSKRLDGREKERGRCSSLCVCRKITRNTMQILGRPVSSPPPAGGHHLLASGSFLAIKKKRNNTQPSIRPIASSRLLLLAQRFIYLLLLAVGYVSFSKLHFCAQKLSKKRNRTSTAKI